MLEGTFQVKEPELGALAGSEKNRGSVFNTLSRERSFHWELTFDHSTSIQVTIRSISQGQSDRIACLVVPGESLWLASVE